MSATSRTYGGHFDRYERWCVDRRMDPGSPRSLEKYASFLVDEKKLTPRYTKDVLSVVGRRWFVPRSATAAAVGGGGAAVPPPPTAGDEASPGRVDDDDLPYGGGRIGSNTRSKKEKRRKDNVFAREDFEEILRTCRANYESDELSLLILCIARKPDWHPRLIVRALNDVEWRKRFLDGLLLPEDSDLRSFLGALIVKTIFTKKHNTYLVRFKNLVRQALDRVVHEASFEMLRRSAIAAKKKKGA